MKNLFTLCCGLFLVPITLIFTAYLSPAYAASADIGAIDLRFCDQGLSGNQVKVLPLVLDPGQGKDFCISLKNKNNTGVFLDVRFPDGTYTAGKSQYKACEPDQSNKRIGQYITLKGENTQTPFFIPKQKVLYLTAHVALPDYYAGYMVGCVTYNIVKDPHATGTGSTVTGNDTTGDTSGFGITLMTRKANFIEFYLSGSITTSIVFVPKIIEGNKTNNELISLKKAEDSKYNILFSLQNNGNVEEDVIYEGSISNVFGFNSIFTGSRKLPAGQTVDVDDIFINIPRYQGSYKINITIKSTPNLGENAGQHYTATSLETKTTQQQAKASLFPLPYITIAAVFIFFFFLWKRKKKKSSQKETHNA